MRKLNEHAHPFFDIRDANAENDFDKKELQLIGFLWCVVPLNEKNYFIQNFIQKQKDI